NGKGSPIRTGQIARTLRAGGFERTEAEAHIHPIGHGVGGDRRRAPALRSAVDAHSLVYGVDHDAPARRRNEGGERAEPGLDGRVAAAVPPSLQIPLALDRLFAGEEGEARARVDDRLHAADLAPIHLEAEAGREADERGADIHTVGPPGRDGPHILALVYSYVVEIELGGERPVSDEPGAHERAAQRMGERRRARDGAVEVDGTAARIAEVQRATGARKPQVRHQLRLHLPAAVDRESVVLREVL